MRDMNKVGNRHTYTHRDTHVSQSNILTHDYDQTKSTALALLCHKLWPLCDYCCRGTQRKGHMNHIISCNVALPQNEKLGDIIVVGPYNHYETICDIKPTSINLPTPNIFATQNLYVYHLIAMSPTSTDTGKFRRDTV